MSNAETNARPDARSIEIGILLRLQRDGTAPFDDFFDIDAVARLLDKRLIQSLDGDRIGITVEGLEALADVQTPANEASGSATPSNEEPTHPADRRRAAAGGDLSRMYIAVLKKVAAAGGTIRLEKLGSYTGHVPRLLREGYLEETGRNTVALTPKGRQRIAAVPPSAESIPPASVIQPPSRATELPPPVEPAPTTSIEPAPAAPSPVIARPDVVILPSTEDEDVRLQAHVLDLLMQHSPSARATYDHYLALVADVSRLEGV